MPRIRALVVDDNPRLLDSMKARIGREISWEIDWATATYVDEGCRLIALSTPPFDPAIAELMFPREDFPEHEPRGLRLIQEASHRSSHTFILAISIGPEHVHDLMDRARQLGAHHVVRRSEFSTESAVHSPTAIAREIQEHLLDNGTVRTCEVSANPHDPGIQGLLYQVGEPTVARLEREDPGVRRPPGRADRASFPHPRGVGRGGLRCHGASGRGRLGESHPKLSRVKDQLVREADRGKLAARVFPPNLVIQHRPQHTVGPVNGWYALSGPFTGRAVTMRNWLLRGRPSHAAVGDLMEELFVDGLGDVYADGRSRLDDPSAGFAFKPYGQQRILQVLGELTEALRREDGGALGGEETAALVRDVRAFVLDRRLPNKVPCADIAGDTYACDQHGDLHAGNVLVFAGRHNRPLLIDTSHCDTAHWAKDLACLAVDLLMRSVDAGTESMLFTGFGTWRELAARFGNGESELLAQTKTPATSAALAAMSWLAANLSRVTPASQPGLDQSGYRWSGMRRSRGACSAAPIIPTSRTRSAR